MTIALTACKGDHLTPPAAPDAIRVDFISAALDGPTDRSWPYAIQMEPFCDATMPDDAEPVRRPIGLHPPDPWIRNGHLDGILSGHTPSHALYIGRRVDGRDCLSAGERYGFHVDLDVKGAEPARFTHIVTGPSDAADTLYRVQLEHGLGLVLTLTINDTEPPS